MQVRPLVHFFVVEAAVVEHMAPVHEGVKLLVGAHSAVLGGKTVGRQLSVLVGASCSRACLIHRGSEAQSLYAAVVDDELRHLSVGLDHSRLVAVHVDSGNPVQAAHERERSSVVHETRNMTVRLSQAEVMEVVGRCLSTSQVGIYYGHLTLKDAFDPHCFAYYGLHGLLIPSLPSCYRMLGKRCLEVSSLVC